MTSRASSDPGAYVAQRQWPGAISATEPHGQRSITTETRTVVGLD
ncbi:MAG: hypothetical protein OXF07_12120 [Rhodobacter sp.]|nr:hypothetical protein [Rhodobacter sp.]MCY4168072.1 hypothetical protein [Rhodobacter sp.]